MSLKDNIITFVSFVTRPAKRKLIRLSMRHRGKKGLEIGGPSSFFSLKGYYPVYLFARQIDGVNYSNNTVWEGKIEEGQTYKFHAKTGYQYISEATDLSRCKDAFYDFVLSCHSLEHVANPLKMLAEVKRVLKPEGEFILILPDKRFTFDINRPYTTLAHLQEDFRNDVKDDDRTHFQESIDLHKHEDGISAAQVEEFNSRVMNNNTFRCVHHHVFDFALIKEMLSVAGFDTEYQQTAHPFHMVTIARKRK